MVDEEACHAITAVVRECGSFVMAILLPGTYNWLASVAHGTGVVSVSLLFAVLTPGGAEPA